jgi:hypothetical protein
MYLLTIQQAVTGKTWILSEEDSSYLEFSIGFG